MMFRFKTKLVGFCVYFQQGHAKIIHFDDADSKSNDSEVYIIAMLEFLVDCIFLGFFLRQKSNRLLIFQWEPIVPLF